MIGLSAKKKKRKKRFRKRPKLHGLTEHALKQSFERGIFLPSTNSLLRALRRGKAIKLSGAEGIEIIITNDGIAAVVNSETKKIITTYRVTTTNKKRAKGVRERW